MKNILRANANVTALATPTSMTNLKEIKLTVICIQLKDHENCAQKSTLLLLPVTAIGLLLSHMIYSIAEKTLVN